MIIQILSKVINKGYLNKDHYDISSPFFAGTNVAFRKKALVEAGYYDNNCKSGEDQDICYRIAQKGYELYFEPKAVVFHKNEMSFRFFIRRWYYYGYHHPYLFKKHANKGIKLYISKFDKSKQSLYHLVIDKKFPLSFIVFFTPFLLLNILLIGLIGLRIAGSSITPMLIVSSFVVISALYCFRFDIKRRNGTESLIFVFLRYTANLALLIGGFFGGLKQKMLYFNGTLDSKN